MESSNEVSRPSSGNSGKLAIVMILVALVAANGYLMWRLRSLGTEVSAIRGKVAQLNSMASVNATNESETVKGLREDLEATKAQASASAGKAKTDAQRLARQLPAQQRKEQQRMASELTVVKRSASDANS
jgi:hypothetical protein